MEKRCLHEFIKRLFAEVNITITTVIGTQLSGLKFRSVMHYRIRASKLRLAGISKLSLI